VLSHFVATLERLCEKAKEISMGVWQGVAMDSLKFHPGTPCPIFVCPAGGWPAATSSPLETPRRTPMKGNLCTGAYFMGGPEGVSEIKIKLTF
jgi:hypothetical protein